jgi:pimeloyl-ACP methyl ester carboxylesterase
MLTLNSISGYENDLPNQTAILVQLMAAIRSGKYTADIVTKKLVLLGHSFGSQLSHQAIRAAPQLVDAALLTGISYPGNPVIAPLLQHFALTVFGARLANTLSPPWNRDNSYFGFADIYSHAHGFFYPPFDKPTLEYAHSIYQPAAIAELATVASKTAPKDPLANLRADGFKGPLLLASGEHDLTCAGDCQTVFHDKYALQGQIFPQASPLKTYVHPGAGHGVNFATNATGFYGELISFLDENLHA